MVSHDSATPLFRQYYALKEEYGQAILMFRLGDFYEMFGPDAETASRVLGITLTSRSLNQSTKVPMCGVPHHSAMRYVKRLLEAGLTVAVADQMEDPAAAKGIVRREVVRVLTPGTLIEEELLEEGAPNYLAVVTKRGERIGFAILESSGGALYAGEVAADEIDSLAAEIAGRAPKEIKLSRELLHNPAMRAVTARMGKDTVSETGDFPSPADLEYFMERQFRAPLASLGMDGKAAAQEAVFEVVRTLRYTFKLDSFNLTLVPHTISEFMSLDAHTLANLEVLNSAAPGGESMLDVFARPRTAMGRRLLRDWLRAPLRDSEAAASRHAAVAALIASRDAREEIVRLLARIVDIERIVNRASYGRTHPKEIGALRDSLALIPAIADSLAQLKGDGRSALIGAIAVEFSKPFNIGSRLDAMLAGDPPVKVDDGGVIRRGYSDELDELRDIVLTGKEWFMRFQEREQGRTSIKSLKVKYVSTFGYYIEVSKPNLHLVPPEYVRKQTLVGAERFSTSELSEHEAKLASAEEKSIALEKEMFAALVREVADARDELSAISLAIKTLDVLISYAETAEREKWARPAFADAPGIEIKRGRHPMVERAVGRARYVANDCALANPGDRIIVLTGPNMGGKSTYMRMAALVVLLAQAGSFVPADGGTIGAVDRIFTRIGASDALAQGQSTFMVEMVETAEILRAATKHSLVILDEVGRGTGTYDGISIAKAVIEYLHEHPRARPLTLFATHYFELTELAQLLPGVKNYRTEVLKEGAEFVFLYTVREGYADDSYGIEVARLAGLPDGVIVRAKKILAELEDVKQAHLRRSREIIQLGLFEE